MAQGLTARLGISRVDDITGLDCLGLPVFVSLRRKGRSVQVHSGKGVTAEDAQVGALMEAVEFAASESASAAAADARLPLSQLVAGWPRGLDLGDFAPPLGVELQRRRQVATVRCERLRTRQSVLLPADLVLLPLPARSGWQIFGSTSNGLASGNSLAEATLHALLEVLERDAVALHIARDGSRLLATGALPPPFDKLARRWQRQGVQLYVRWLPNPIGLPCFEAGLHDLRTTDGRLVLSRGWGLHFDRDVALSRAVCEAAQSRLSAMLAQRPDLPGGPEMARRMAAAPTPEQTRRLLARLAQTKGRVPWHAVPHEAPASIATALQALLLRLELAGLGPVFRRRMYLDDDAAALRGLHVVKVIVARCETPIGAHPRVGPRLLALLQEN